MVSIILVTYNEKDNISNFVLEILKFFPNKKNVEIIIVDDNSTDGTIQSIQKLNLSQVKLIIRKKTRGLASAFYRGILESQGEYIAWLDCDGSHPAYLIPIMHSNIVQKKYDVAIASRYVKGGKDCRNFFRVFSSKLINQLAQIFLGFNIKDYTSGMIFIKRKVFDDVVLIPVGYGEYFIELVYNMKKKGFKIIEIGYHFHDRNSGYSKTTSNWLKFLVHGFFYILRIVQARFRFRN